MRMFDTADGIASWATARSEMDVYMIRSNTLFNQANGISNDWLKNNFVPVLAGKPIALDVGGATWMSTDPKQLLVAKRELKLIIDLFEAGANVQYISLQSVLSKPLPGTTGENEVEYPLEQRYSDIASYMNLILTNKYISNPNRNINLKWGIIDARPSKAWEWRSAYLGLKAHLAAEQLPALDHIHLDIPCEIPNTGKHGVTWDTVKEVENYVKDVMGCKFGLVSTSKEAGYTDEKTFHDAVVAIPGTQKGSPDRFLIMSWFPHPEFSLPEDASGDNYPVMRTVLDFAGEMGRIRRAQRYLRSG